MNCQDVTTPPTPGLLSAHAAIGIGVCGDSCQVGVPIWLSMGMLLWITICSFGGAFSGVGLVYGLHLPFICVIVRCYVCYFICLSVCCSAGEQLEGLQVGSLVGVLVGAMMWSLLCHQCLLFFCGLNHQFICVVVCQCLCEVVCRSVCSFVCPFVIGLFVSAFTGLFISSKHSCDPEEIPCPFHLPWRYTLAI